MLISNQFFQEVDIQPSFLLLLAILKTALHPFIHPPIHPPRDMLYVIHFQSFLHQLNFSLKLSSFPGPISSATKFLQNSFGHSYLELSINFLNLAVFLLSSTILTLTASNSFTSRNQYSQVQDYMAFCNGPKY